MQGTQTRRWGGGGRKKTRSPPAAGLFLGLLLPPHRRAARLRLRESLCCRKRIMATEGCNTACQQCRAERAGTANKPSPESNSSCQRGERARCPAVSVPNRQIRASARPALPGEVNKTLSESLGHNNMQRGAQQQRHGRPYSPPSPRWRQPCPWKRTLAAPESRHDRPAAMTAHIPEVDSCYAADLTRSPLPHPQVVNSEEKAGLDVRA